MISTGEYYRKRISEAWSKTSTGTVKNIELAAFTDLLNPVLPDNISVDDRNAREITYANAGGQGFTLKKDSRDRLACVFTRAMAFTNAYDLLQIEPESFLRFAVDFFASLTGWNEELEALKVRETKRKKIKSIAEKNIRIMVEEVMKDINHSYCLANQESRVILSIRIPGRRKIEIPISHRNFIAEVPLIAPAVDRILELFGQTGFRIQVKTHGNNIIWKEGGKHAG